MKAQHVSIWFLIGLQLAIFGALVTGSGIYDFCFPPPLALQTTLFTVHAGIWWGAVMFILGLFYTIRFWPWRQTS